MNDFIKAAQVINSCKTLEQLHNAEMYLMLYYRKHVTRVKKKALYEKNLEGYNFLQRKADDLFCDLAYEE